MNWKQKLVDGETVIVRKTAALGKATKTIDGDTGEDAYTFVISSGAVDRHGDTIDPEGWDLRAYRSNPVVLWQHDPYPGPIGSGKNVRVEDGVLKADVVFSKTHPLAIRAKDLLDEGHLRAVSVGFKIVEWTINEERPGFMPMDITKAELWEFSLVSIPANEEALRENARNAVTDAEIDAAFAAKQDEINEALSAEVEGETSKGTGSPLLEIIL